MIQRLLLAAAVLLLASQETTARSGKPFIRINDISIGSQVSGNGFGIQHPATLGLRFGRRVVLEGGPRFAQVTWKNTGYQFGARYLLMRESESFNGHFNLGVFANAGRFENQGLNRNAIDLEKKTAMSMHNDEAADFEGLRYSGWEYSAGIGFSYRFGFGLLLRSEAALSFYDTQQLTCYDINVFRATDGVSLRLGAGIGWAFAKSVSARAARGVRPPAAHSGRWQPGPHSPGGKCRMPAPLSSASARCYRSARS